MTSDFLKKFFTYGLGIILQSALGVILLPLYMRFFSPDEYGVISVLSVTMALLALSISAGMMNGLIRLYYETEGVQRKKLIGTTCLWYLAVATLGGSILFALAKPLSTELFRVDAYENAIRIVGFAFFSLMLPIVPFYILRLEKKAGQYVGFSLFNFLVDFTLKLYFIVSLGKGIEGYFASSAIANMLTVGLMIPFIAKNVKLSPDIPALKQLLRLGLPYVLSGIAVWTLSLSDRLMLNHFSGEAVVGIYAVAYSFANMFRVLLATPMSLLVDPFFFAFAADRPAADTKKLLQKMLIYSFLSGGVLFLVITLGSGEVLRILITHFGAKKEYLEAANLVPILTLAPFVYFLVMPSILGGLWVKKPIIFSIACACAAGLNAGLNFFIIPSFGATGAAMSAVIAYLLMIGVSYAWLERVLPGGYEWKKVAKAMFYLGLAFAIGWQIWIDQPLISLLVRVMVGIFVFSFLTFFTGGILTKVERGKILAYSMKNKIVG